MNNSITDYIVLDVETTTHNKGHPFDPRNKLISYAYTNPDTSISFRYFRDPSFRRELTGTTCVGFNFKFDLHWLHALLPNNIKIWDCQLAEHIYTGQKGQFISLDECLTKYNLETKLDAVKDLWNAGVQTDEIDVGILQEYNCWDVEQTRKLFLVQQELLTDQQKELVYLLGEDLKVLADIERNGLLFDKEEALSALTSFTNEVASTNEKLEKFLPRIFHGVFNWDSGDHLSCLLYGGTLKFDYTTSVESVYKSGAKKGEVYIKNSWHEEIVSFPRIYKPLENSMVKKSKDAPPEATKYYQVDGPTISQLKGGGKQGKELIALLQTRSEKQKLVEMLESLFKQFNEKQWEDNLVHGTYNQNVAVTGRLSSSQPNMQNIPPEIDKFFISRYAN